MTSDSTHRPPRIALFGKFGVQNIGNECTLAAMLDNLRAYRLGGDLFCVCSEPSDTTCRHNIPAVRIEAVTHRPGAKRSLLRLMLVRFPAEVRGWLSALRTLRGTDALIMTGTGMLTDSGESPLGFPYEIFKWACVARCSGCKVRFVAVGVGPMRRRLTRMFIHGALRLSDYRSYRDAASRRRLQDQGAHIDHDAVLPDLAFSLRPDRLSAHHRADGSRRFIGVGIMDNYGPPDTRIRRTLFFDNYIEKTAAFVAWLLQQNYAVRILYGDLSCDAEPRLRLRRALVRQGFQYDDQRVSGSDIRTEDDLLRQLSATDIVVSPRYHNLVLAMMLNKPVIALSYDYKNEALLTEAGLGEYWQRIEELDVSKLIEQFQHAERNSLEIRRLLQRLVPEYRRRWESEYPRVFANL